MIEKRLGKIDFVEFGSMKDYPFQLGLQLGFSMSGSGVMDGGKYTVNMSPDCHWEIGTRHTNLAESLDRVAKILKDAKVNYISELLGKPVEVTLEDGMFKEFRILTKGVRGRTYRGGEESHGLGDPAGVGRVRPKAYRRDRRDDFMGAA